MSVSIARTADWVDFYIPISLLVMIWLCPSLFLIVLGSPDNFQRFGSVGVAVSLMFAVFGHQRWRSLSTVFSSARSLNAHNQLELQFLELNARITTLEDGVDFSEARREELDAAKRLAKIGVRRLQIIEPDESGAQVDSLLTKRIRQFAITEYVLIITSTAQWGYGDLLHCWINGNGWKPC